MAELYLEGVTITKHVTSVVPEPDITQVVNRLDSGDYHVHTIGGPSVRVSVEAVVGYEGKLLLDNAIRLTSPVRVTGDGKWRDGVIDKGTYSINYIPPKYYQVGFDILQQEEGDL